MGRRGVGSPFLCAVQGRSRAIREPSDATPGRAALLLPSGALFGSAEVADRVPADALREVCRRYCYRPEPELQKNLAQIVERSAAAGLPDDILDVLTRIAIEAGTRITRSGRTTIATRA